jgi:aryl-alcohol dehydrogenase-like predicted oxidoreductase
MPKSALPIRPLGDSGLEVSVVGLGCNNFGKRLDLDGTAAVLDAALDAGVTFFDTADVYGGGGESERLMGEALEGRRDEYVLATKFGWESGTGAPEAPRGSRDYIRWAIEGSLRRLRIEKVDLYQYHRPDGVTPLEETLSALDELVAEGMVGAIGCSNFTAGQLEEADRISRERGLARFVSIQNEYSLLQREIESEVAPACERLDVSILPYFPLASGLLTGKYRRDRPAPPGGRLSAAGQAGSDEQFDIVEALDRFAKTRGIGVLELAIAGLAVQPKVASVIAGATRPEQVNANVAAIDWQPSEDDLAELDRIAPTPRG